MWFYYLDVRGQEFGPVPEVAIRRMFASGFFPAGRGLLVRQEGWNQPASVGALFPQGFGLEPFATRLPLPFAMYDDGKHHFRSSARALV